MKHTPAPVGSTTTTPAVTQLPAKEETVVPQLRGHVASGFEPVAEVFRAICSDGGEQGAACAVIINGETVVDLYGGQAREGEPFAESTRSVVFSVSKGVTAVLLMMAADQGRLDLDEPIATVWPEFAAHGKHRLTPRQLLAHRAGLIAPQTDLTPSDLKSWFPVVNALAAQEPLWEPGTQFAYHPITVGYLAGEVLRRATGKRPSQWLSSEVAGPLGIDMTGLLHGEVTSDPACLMAGL